MRRQGGEKLTMEERGMRKGTERRRRVEREGKGRRKGGDEKEEWRMVPVGC